MGGNGNGNDSMGVGREGEQESHFLTPLMTIFSSYVLRLRCGPFWFTIWTTLADTHAHTQIAFDWLYY